MRTPKSEQMKLHRRSIRLKEYDYSQPGAYFVTMATFQRDGLFGQIANEEMQLNEFGTIAEDCWCAIPEHFANVELGTYVIMPNHVHGIIVIHDDGTGTIYRAPTVEQFGKPIAGPLLTIIRTYKAAVTREIRHKSHVTNIWQRNYYQHVIRNEK
jgi:putative transposase